MTRVLPARRDARPLAHSPSMVSRQPSVTSPAFLPLLSTRALLALCLAAFLSVLCLPSPAHGQTVFASRSGVSVHSALLLRGSGAGAGSSSGGSDGSVVNVGESLHSLSTRQDEQQAEIDELKRRNQTAGGGSSSLFSEELSLLQQSIQQINITLQHDGAVLEEHAGDIALLFQANITQAVLIDALQQKDAKQAELIQQQQTVVQALNGTVTSQGVVIHQQGDTIHQLNLTVHQQGNTINQLNLTVQQQGGLLGNQGNALTLLFQANLTQAALIDELQKKDAKQADQIQEQKDALQQQQTIIHDLNATVVSQVLQIQHQGDTINQQGQTLDKQANALAVLNSTLFQQTILITEQKTLLEQQTTTIQQQGAILVQLQVALAAVNATATAAVPYAQYSSTVTNIDSRIVVLQSNATAAVTADRAQQQQIDLLLTANRTQAEQLDRLQGGSSGGDGASSSTVVQLSSAVQNLSSVVNALLTPRSVVGTAGSNSVTVGWSTTAYRVTSLPPGYSCESDGVGGDQACTVTGLTNNQPYQFQVQLTTAAGAGPLSAPSAPVTPLLACRPLLIPDASSAGSLVLTPDRSPGCPLGEYSPGAKVNVTAKPAAGSGLVSWGDCSSGSSTPIVTNGATVSLTIPASTAADPVLSCSATFGQCFALTLPASVTGGVVYVTPAQSSGCAVHAYASGARVQVQAVPSNGYAFTAWSGASSSTSPTLQLTISAAASLTPAFGVAPLPKDGASFAWGQRNTSAAVANDPLVSNYGGLNSPNAVCFDPRSGEMYVVDTGNSRVLMFASSDSNVATRVLGQADMSGKQCNRGSSAGSRTAYWLCSPSSCAVDSVGGIWVVDASNTRVLYFEAGATSASYVIGQPDMMTVVNSASATATNLNKPTGVAVDSQGGLYVADLNFFRVTYYPTPFISGVATRVYGQNSMTAAVNPINDASRGKVGGGLQLAIDLDGGLWVTESSRCQVEYFNAGSNAYNATRTVGWLNFNVPSDQTIGVPSGVAVDPQGNVYTADSYTQSPRILMFPANYYAPAGQFRRATQVWGQTSFRAVNQPTPPVDGFHFNPSYLAVDPAGRIIVAEPNRHRILKLTGADCVYTDAC